MTLTELLTEAQKLSPSEQFRLITELLQWFSTDTLQYSPTPLSTQPQPSNLLTLLARLSPIEDDWPDFDEGLLPLEDDIDL